MFTGIVAATGTVISLERDPSGEEDGSARLRIQAGPIVTDLPPGGSLAVDGVCLTSAPAPAQGGTSPEGGGTEVLTADVMGETLRRTTLGSLRPGAVVNLERCLPADGRLDGHIVQGHVDGTGRILSRIPHGAWQTVRVGIPHDLAPLLAEKGAIAVDGISLTVTAVSAAGATEPWFEIGLIPATLAATGLGAKTEGDPVNLEADLMAKYAARLAAFRGPGRPPETTPETSRETSGEAR